MASKKLYLLNYGIVKILCVEEQKTLLLQIQREIIESERSDKLRFGECENGVEARQVLFHVIGWYMIVDRLRLKGLSRSFKLRAKNKEEYEEWTNKLTRNI